MRQQQQPWQQVQSWWCQQHPLHLLPRILLLLLLLPTQTPLSEV
jgi:hypothetical protein